MNWEDLLEFISDEDQDIIIDIFNRQNEDKFFTFAEVDNYFESTNDFLNCLYGSVSELDCYLLWNDLNQVKAYRTIDDVMDYILEWHLDNEFIEELKLNPISAELRIALDNL